MSPRFRMSVYTVCFNEERMLPHFLNHYSRIANRIVIYDNQSTDRSVSIAQERPNVEVRSFDTGGKLSEITLTKIRSTCWKDDDADYVVVCDVDEILFVADFDRFLADHADVDVFKPIGFQMIANEFPTDYDRPITDQVKNGAFAQSFSKMVLFRPSAVKDMNYGPGSHSAMPTGYRQLKIYDAARQGADLKLLHYKFLGVSYVSGRNAFLGHRLGEEFRTHNYGYHYRFGADVFQKKFNEIKWFSFNCIDHNRHPVLTLSRAIVGMKDAAKRLRPPRRTKRAPKN